MSIELREEARRREEEKAALASKRELFAGDLRILSRLPEGRRVFRWLLEQGDLFSEEYLPGSLGAYRAGVKAASLRLWRVLREHLPAESFIAIAFEPEIEAAAEEGRGRGGETRRDDIF